MLFDETDKLSKLEGKEGKTYNAIRRNGERNPLSAREETI